MPDRFPPVQGSIVTYVERDPGDSAVFRRAVAIGPQIDDPQTGHAWLPVLRPDRVVTIVSRTWIVDTAPTGLSESQGWSVAQAIRTQDALDTALRDLEDLDPADGLRVLTDFVRVVSPLEPTLDALLTMDPTGASAIAVMCLVNAADMVGSGDIAAGRAAINAAQDVLDDDADSRGYEQF